MNQEFEKPEVIFILGIMPRSGTHFLANLLCQHPDCAKSVIPEDSLLTAAHFLRNYIDALTASWAIQADISGLNADEILFKSLGDGLHLFLQRAREKAIKNRAEQFQLTIPSGREKKRLVTKTPSVAHLNYFFSLFPNDKLVIIVRDGRANVESQIVSFDENGETAIRNWAVAARRILAFEKENRGKFLLVKYEELHAATESELKKILSFLELDVERYDFQKALDLPVVGSSTFKRGDGDVHWLPVKKTDEFNPLARAADWSRARHERFNWLAREELLKLGYEPLEFGGNKLYWQTQNQFQDLLWQAKIWRHRFGRVPKFLEKRFKIYFGK